jgi:hypothetical protein
MAATYPNLLASGITDEGRFDPFDLFSGSGPHNTTQYQAADGQAIRQFEVCTLSAGGRLVPLAQSGDYATGTITVGGQPADGETTSINGSAIAFVDADPAAGECLIGADTTETATNLRAVINADPDTYGVTASGSGTTVTLTANTIGTAGNAITLAEAVTDADFTVSGATLSGANAAEDVPSGNAIAIAAQPVDAATPGNWVPVFISGGFNHEALLWPAGMGTLAQRRAAFTGSPIYVQQLL